MTVKGDMEFQAAEVGRAIGWEIRLFGEDKVGDNLPAGDPVGDDELYVFRWGRWSLAGRTARFTSGRRRAADLRRDQRGIGPAR